MSVCWCVCMCVCVCVYVRVCVCVCVSVTKILRYVGRIWFIFRGIMDMTLSIRRGLGSNVKVTRQVKVIEELFFQMREILWTARKKGFSGNFIPKKYFVYFIYTCIFFSFLKFAFGVTICYLKRGPSHGWAFSEERTFSDKTDIYWQTGIYWQTLVINLMRCL